MNESKGTTILLFDVDGTLTLPRQKLDQEMSNFMMEVHKAVPLAVVSGSDLPKVVEQLGESLEDVLNRFDYVFSENGLVSVSRGTTFPVQVARSVSTYFRMVGTKGIVYSFWMISTPFTFLAIKLHREVMTMICLLILELLDIPSKILKTRGNKSASCWKLSDSNHITKLRCYFYIINVE
ncbi:Uncharacterized protein BM_BM14027 [Brugia malayi]|uniref:Phosphomannomutase n=1 Tax=Brugia malayi TaxID=6279 RepID=A0A0K0J000_BRUMA|nr:Uncharacterized protein BM_BM14027 [Brugia malayi]CRZ24009.1 Bm14027, isoform a [Brugia malayi]VIO86833.1 Uncharacterized protein BM_BM14027 [Brugia malayi]